MRSRLFICTILLIIATASCKTTREAYLPLNNPWSAYEKAIDASQNCEQLHSVYIAFCQRLIALDGQIPEREWKAYVTTNNFLERKMNRKAKKFCGYTYFDNILENTPATSDGEGNDIPTDDFDFEEWEDNFDYDEFDATR